MSAKISRIRQRTDTRKALLVLLDTLVEHEGDVSRKKGSLTFKKIAKLFKNDPIYEKLFRRIQGNVENPKDWARIVTMLATFLFDHVENHRPSIFLPSRDEILRDFAKLSAKHKYLSATQIIKLLGEHKNYGAKLRTMQKHLKDVGLSMKELKRVQTISASQNRKRAKSEST